jgi:hypothetical protein
LRRLLIGLLLTVVARGADELQVTVYDVAKVPHETREEAFEVLRWVFRRAGIRLRVTAGDLKAEEASIFNYARPKPGVSDVEARCAARQDIALQVIDGQPRGLRPTVLGMAQPWARDGLNVKVFDARIDVEARKDHLDHATVLGYAMAHEIGHVLLRNNIHSAGGLMASLWRNLEVQRMGSRLLTFARQESSAMRSNLRSCSSPDREQKSDRHSDCSPANGGCPGRSR